MRILTLFGMLAIGAFAAKGQFIIAGQYGPGDIYTDLSPDSVVSGYPPSDIFHVDIDSNGSSDFYFSGYWAMGTSGVWQTETSHIVSQGNNQMALDFYDSCFSQQQNLMFVRPIARIFSYGDTINAQSSWTNETRDYLNYSEYNYSSMYSCSSTTFGSSPAYIGVRVFDNGDTLYGWFSVSLISNWVFNVREFACNRNVTAISELNPFNVLIFYSIESHTVNIQVHTGAQPDLSINTYDASGRLVLHTLIIRDQQLISIDVSGFEAGIYFLVVSDGKGNQSAHKFMVSR
jgi:hypothetical protein